MAAFTVALCQQWHERARILPDGEGQRIELPSAARHARRGGADSVGKHVKLRIELGNGLVLTLVRH